MFLKLTAVYFWCPDVVQGFGLRPALISFMQALADSMPELNRKVENMMLDTITNVISDRPYVISLGEFVEVDEGPQVRLETCFSFCVRHS